MVGELEVKELREREREKEWNKERERGKDRKGGEQLVSPDKC